VAKSFNSTKPAKPAYIKQLLSNVFNLAAI